MNLYKVAFKVPHLISVYVVTENFNDAAKLAYGELGDYKCAVVESIELLASSNTTHTSPLAVDRNVL